MHATGPLIAHWKRKKEPPSEATALAPALRRRPGPAGAEGIAPPQLTGPAASPPSDRVIVLLVELDRRAAPRAGGPARQRLSSGFRARATSSLRTL